MMTEHIDLNPRIVRDPKAIAAYWKKIKVGEDRHIIINTRKTSDSEWEHLILEGSPAFAVAFSALANPEFSKLINVEAMVFPCLNGVDEVVKKQKFYKEILFRQDERNDLIPLAKDRKAFFDPWKDGKVADRKKGERHVGILPESCILVTCPHCHGAGHVPGKIDKGTKDIGWVECRNCNGTGKTGAILCEECGGKGRYYSHQRIDNIVSGLIKCEKCGGTGKMLSVLQYNQVDDHKVRKSFIYMPNQEDYVPKPLLKLCNDKCDCRDGAEYKLLLSASSQDGRCKLPASEIPSDLDRRIGLCDKMNALCKENDDSTARYSSESVRLETCVRLVRFRIRFYVGPSFNLPVYPGYGSHCGTPWPDDFRVDPCYWDEKLFKDPAFMKHKTSDIVVWLDTITGEAYTKFPAYDSTYVRQEYAFGAILLRMGRQVLGISNTPTKPKKLKTRKVHSSQKKRWKFVVIGILFGWLGVHYLYAKRWILFLLIWTCAIAGVTLAGDVEKTNVLSSTSNGVSSAMTKEESRNTVIGGACMFVWALLWLGGTFFIKKDGNGNRM